MNALIESMARKIFALAEANCGVDEKDMDARWENLPSAGRGWYRGLALAAWTAGVGALSDKQINDLEYALDRACSEDDRRAALLALVKENNNDD